MERHLICTVCDEPYWLGVVALHNSYRKHSRDGFDFAVIVYGSDELVQRAELLGMRVIANPPFPVERLPTGKWHQDPERLPAMYGRLLIPQLFPEYRRIVYIDCDSLILQSLRPLAEMPMVHPIAATRCNGPMSYNVIGRDYAGTGPMSSMYVIDQDLWRSHEIDRKWLAAIRDDSVEYPFTVQGVLSVALWKDWHELPWEAQAHAGHAWQQYKAGKVYLLHFMGANPWDPVPSTIPDTPSKQAARAMWRDYLCAFS